MHNPIFIHKDLVRAGQYLPGDCLWADEVRLETAYLAANPPSAGSVTITLEVGGVLTDKVFVLAASGDAEVRRTLTLDVLVTAGQRVRWLITDAPVLAEDSAHHVSITLSAWREADVAAAEVPMTVWWRDGLERFRLFNYDPATGVFTAVNAALAASRAVITAGASFSIAIQGGEVLRVTGGTLYTDRLVAGGLDLAAQPQLQFYAGVQPVAVLTYEGALHVAGMTEGVPVAAAGQFDLGGAALELTGVTAVQFEQPL